MDNTSLYIEKSYLDFIDNICGFTGDIQLEPNAAANCFASNIAVKFFNDDDVETSSGLHNVYQILNELDIADIYVNNAYVNVRIFFNDNELCVPKVHFEKDILPAAYMFIRLTEDLSQGEVVGFILPEAVDKYKEHNGYYEVNIDELLGYDDVRPYLVSDDETEITRELSKQIYAFADGKYDIDSDFVKKLLVSRAARELLINAVKTKSIMNFVEFPDVQEDVITGADDAGFSDNTEEEVFNVSDSSDILSGETLELEPDSFDDNALELDTQETAFGEINSDNEMLLLDDETGLSEEPVQDFEPITDTNLDTDSNFEQITENDMLDEIGEFDSNDDDILYSTSTTPSISAFEDTEQGLEDSNEQFVHDDLGMIDELNESADSSTDYTNDNIASVDNDAETDSQEFSYEDTLNTDKEADENNKILSDVFNEDDDHTSALEELYENSSDSQSATAEPAMEVYSQDEQQDEQITAVDNIVQNAPQNEKKRSLIPLLGIAALLAVGACVAVYKLSPESLPFNIPQKIEDNNINNSINNSDTEAMPVESVEEQEDNLNSEEGTSVSVPAIEKNLDASILVSNLVVSWEVPAGYASNTAANRYFTRLGKVIQLNLKTELMLLSKPPITNKIIVEVEYNSAIGQFEVKGVVNSSGEQLVDSIIVKTIKSALNSMPDTNKIFSSTQGNPLLVIKL